MTQNLTRSEQKKLLTLAREAIVEYVQEGILPFSDESAPALQGHQGCFVSIKINGALRGCIGSFVSCKPLYKLVQEMAISAATRDPRFYPMKPADLAEFSVEISVLSPLEKIASPEGIKVGTHGLYIEKNACRGVLLPQVAVEYGWDRDTFLSQTCLKAGLKADDWKEGADIYVFSAQIIA
ncbi:MAG: AmmeMemoRadiSam system protein A [Deltaproteobacteria bacterium]|nr:AmmeMemoRadiSam system protein A [Deltaproteobacteria bacterium]